MAFLLKLDPETQRLAAIAAASRRLSLHAWVLAAVRAQLLRDARGPKGAAVAAALDAAE